MNNDGTGASLTDFIQRGDVLAAAGHFDEAAALFEQAKLAGPDNPEPWFKKGSALSALEQIAQALEEFRGGIRLLPVYAETKPLGETLQLVARLEPDTAAALRLMRLEGDYRGSLLLRGWLKAVLDDRRGALADFDELLKAEPENAQAWYLRGKIKAGLPDPDGAVADISRAIELSPGMARAYAQRAIAFLGLDKPGQAAADLAKAAELDPSLKPWLDECVGQFVALLERQLKFPEESAGAPQAPRE